MRDILVSPWSLLAVCSTWMLLGCSSPKDEATQTAIDYQRSLMKGEYATAHQLASKEDRRARSEDELDRDLLPTKLAAMDTSVGDQISYRRTSISMNDKQATVVLKISAPDPFQDGKTLSSTQTYRLVKENGTWKVDTNWEE